MAKRAGRVTGEVVMRDLASVAPNDWNPNEVPEHMMLSIERGFREEGWLKSHALLVWGTDEKGKAQNLIIDGEHRWQVGSRLGMAQGPMVFLEGVTRTKAMALTVKLDKRRGAFLAEPLAAVLAELRRDLETDDLAEELGFTGEELLRSLPSVDALADGAAFAPKGKAPDPVANNPTAGAGSPYVRVVQLYLSVEDHQTYHSIVPELGRKLGFPNPSLLVMDLLRKATARGNA